MRQVLILVTIFMVGGIGPTLIPGRAEATPVPAAMSLTIAPLVEKVDYWRRYYRRYGYPPVVVPVPVPVPEVNAPALNAPIVVEIPARPASCGEYRYWDGERCLDARYNKPYLGPR
jgi:hypothetical protein